ncbi:MAG: Gfo/Idh/MocA family oxidoreductase [Chloroflexi bacterium]|nr:Gfo/Idh/MocA family oxidoreductase [Chloroflexota bacterium]MCY3582716.1 Gfo/Idh/MocA family oxidoreductase [Chloroflexota bacterium]MCY3717579.1 Gfo/Idh/MocA family oxidoreductase [Chloroflexota bacterium]MDE2651988.1 Gfo/Idh/MocA family oxidoreductase [Chloroflexota bacterium]MXV93694.1 Gfo/Idh/MocA family oxidoreductase [Chloroflexota bacterium]
MPSFALRQSVSLPSQPRPIVSIGMGGIVHDAHYPAYKIAGFSVAGGFDIDSQRARMMADKFAVPRLYDSLAEAVRSAPADAVFDVAVPGSAIPEILAQVPKGRAVLIQKPMGDGLAQAREILKICRERELVAAINFQLRFAPFIIAARDMIEQGLIGELRDLEVRMQINTPWHLWQFLFPLPRVEILYHSIHYVDLVRSFCGSPASVYAKTISHPSAPELRGGSRSMIIMDYGDNPRVNVMTNHSHAYGAQKQQSYIKFEGSRGAIQIRAGLNMNYPHGAPDRFEYVLLGDDEPTWRTLEISGSWFPEAFIGTMASLMRYVDGEAQSLPTSVEDAIETMATVEAAYESSAAGGTPIPAP